MDFWIRGVLFFYRGCEVRAKEFDNREE